MTNIKNAQIQNTMLGKAHLGITTCYLYLEYGNSGSQGFGGSCLDDVLLDAKGEFIKRVGHAFGMEYIMRILETVGVDKWEDLKGKYIRVKFGNGSMGFGSDIIAIGHITEDNWRENENL